MSDRYVETLRARHEALDHQIGQELKTVQPDLFRIAELKKTKLRLKDKIVRTSVQEQFASAH